VACDGVMLANGAISSTLALTFFMADRGVMAFRVVLRWLIPVVFSAAAWADTLAINPNHPDQYTVVKGDTLWDISGKFLQHPWQWPQLLRNNPQIKDPHWIYPGDTLYFSMVNGQPQLSLSPANGGTEKWLPQVRETDIAKAVKVIPTDAIAQFLSSPKVVSADELSAAPYVLEIVGERMMAGAGDQIYVRGIDQPQGLGYTLYRQGAPYVSPESREILGYEAEYNGDASLQALGDPSILAIAKSAGQIRKGDRLMPNEAGGLALNYYPHAPEQAINGHILRVMGGMTQIGWHDVVVIDKGTRDGLEAGHVLDVFRLGRKVVDRFSSQTAEAVKLPDERAGTVLVFRPFERVSYALVMEASGAIHTIDRVQTPSQ